jgi:NAD(P)-dependent dehydrogenase (short-subunit alcohol dehydrogenase family)
MSDQRPITAYKASKNIDKQTQELPGVDKEMAPTAEHAKQEYWDENGKPYLKEYQGTGKLEGKKVIITGGDSGIGRSVAIFFAREGADVSIIYLPQEQKDADWVKSHIESTTKRSVHLIPADLEQTESPPAIVKSHIDKFGRLDILVNNASKQILCADIKDLDVKQVESTYKLNIISMIQMTTCAVPHMRRGSAIINTTSVTAYKGSPSLIDYSSTKGAIVSFTRSLAIQLAPKGIRVNAIAPGPFYTPLQPASRSPENMEDWSVGDVPLHGRAGQPAEIAEAYVLLAGPGGNFMTGSVIHINAGQHCGGS